eukprot:PLAT1583.2.p1 GENE.PLAT1583.2~~PLAT1583.2.p1  ORF type:complete len:634 (-),score=376.92 PLAT1583.2:84-1985(-)
MSVKLTAGAIPKIYKHETVDKPVLQVRKLRPIKSAPGKPERFRLSVSDGTHFMQAMLATGLNDLIRDSVLAEGAVVQLQDYMPSDIPQRRIIIILSLTVVSGTVPEIGKPVTIDGSAAAAGAPPLSSGGAAAAAPPAAAGAPSSSATAAAAAAAAVAPAAAPAASRAPPAGKMKMGGAGRGTGSSSGGLGAVVRDESRLQVHPVKNLNPFLNRWTIKCRATAKSDVRTWTNQRGSGKLFSLDLLDEAGTEIRATFFNDAVDKYFDTLQSGSVYYFSGGRLKASNPRFSSIKNDYELTFDVHSDIRPAADDGGIKHMQFNFTPLDALAGLIGKTVDVLAVVQSAAEVATIMTRAGRETQKRDLTLVDSSMASVRVTLWGDSALADPGYDSKPVLALKGAKVSDYGGVSLSTYRSTMLDWNPELAEAATLRSWFDGGGAAAGSVRALSGAGGRRARTPEERKTMSAILDERLGMGEKRDYLSFRGTLLSYSKVDSGPWYPSCMSPDCKKKVLDDGSGGWICDSCSKTHASCKYRYAGSLDISDHTSGQWVSYFNDHGEGLLGKSADEMYELKDSSPEEYAAVFASAAYRKAIFTVSVKQEIYQDMPRLKVSLVDIQPMDFVAESKHLLSVIDKYA